MTTTTPTHPLPEPYSHKLRDLEDMERTLLEVLYRLPNNRANAIARTHIETAFMWARRSVAEEWREKEMDP